MVNIQSHHLDLIFHALSDPTRRAMLSCLTRCERPITQVAEPFKISLPAISKHVKVLERARLVKRRKQGSSSYLSLNAESMQTANQWMEHYRKFWEQRFDALEAFLNKEKKK